MAVVAVARTAVRPLDGELAGWNPVELAAAVGREVLERAGLHAGELDEVAVGCPDPVGACGADAARAIVLAAGWPVSVGGLVVDRAETSGLAAVQAATAAIRGGQARTVLVVGLGLCSVVPPGAAALKRIYGAPWGGVAERFAADGGLLPGPRVSERAARAEGIGRGGLDAAAEESRRRRIASGTAETSPKTETTTGTGASKGTGAATETETNPKSETTTGTGTMGMSASTAIVAVAARPGNTAARGVYRGDPVAKDAVRDWGDTGELPPAFDSDGLLTAATFAPPADGVAAVLLHAGPATALATVAGMGRAAGDPFDPLGNAGTAVSRALAEAGVELDAVDDISVVEHDAATAMLLAQSLNIDSARINRGGGAVAMGNSGAAEELRLITDALAAPTGERLLTISAGPTGSTAIIWRTDI